MIGRKHPSLYSFLSEMQKEQADTECMLQQLELGQKIRKGTDLRQKRAEERISAIVARYHEYVENDDVVTYLPNIAKIISF